MNPKISVIVPVYKAEKYLHRCVDSILSQTFTDFEVLLINDGSPDRSGEICDEYAQRDERVRVFHKENGGVSSARNLGLSNATGDYVYFVDSDDYISELCLFTFSKHFDEDFVVSGFCRVQETVREIRPKEGHIRKNKELHALWGNTSDFIFWFPWAKLYKNSIIRQNKIRFNEKLYYSEDFVFVLDYVNYIDDFFLLSTSEYYHIQEFNRFSKYQMDYLQYEEHRSVIFSKLERMEEECKSSFIEVKKDIEIRLLKCFAVFLRDCESYEEFMDQVKKMKENRNIKDLLKNSYSKWYNKGNLLLKMAFNYPYICFYFKLLNFFNL